MAKREFCYLFLTCEDDNEAHEIATALLEKKLIVCAKQIPVNATYWWDGEITRGHEKMLVMESALDLFDTVEKEVAKLHSYDTFVLEATPIAKVSRDATKWMNDNLKPA